GGDGTYGHAGPPRAPRTGVGQRGGHRRFPADLQPRPRRPDSPAYRRPAPPPVPRALPGRLRPDHRVWAPLGASPRTVHGSIPARPVCRLSRSEFVPHVAVANHDRVRPPSALTPTRGPLKRLDDARRWVASQLQLLARGAPNPAWGGARGLASKMAPQDARRDGPLAGTTERKKKGLI